MEILAQAAEEVLPPLCRSMTTSLQSRAVEVEAADPVMEQSIDLKQTPRTQQTELVQPAELD
jgi:hypothetical protein